MSAHLPRRSQKTDPLQRSLGSRVKLWIGGVGIGVCALWWPVLVAVLFLSDPALDGLSFNTDLTILTVSLLLTVLFGVILRSGLRGPADPLSPDASRRVARDEALPQALVADPHVQPKPASRKKRHLRLV